jgi:NAD(P)-dependent dehydrogenase (short-subunit alcohol dehydrogenase family)
MLGSARFDFQGRVALVTGAGSGLGAAICRALSAEGMSLVVCDLIEERLDALPATLPGPGRVVLSATVDVTDLAAMRALRDRVRAELGGIDLLVNNAGVAAVGPIATQSPEDFGWVLDVDLKAVAWCTQLFLADMLKRPGRAHVVNIASAAGMLGLPYMGAYATAKAGVVAFSEGLMAEHPARELGVSVICPGFVPTRIIEDSRIDMGESDATEGAQAQARKLISRPRRHPDQVAAAVVRAVRSGRFLVSLYAEGWALRFLRLMPEAIRGVVRRGLARQFKPPR